MVIGIAGKGERAEHQGVHRRELQQPQIGIGRGQVGQVKGNQVVAQHEGRPIGELVQLGQGRGQTAAGMHQAPAGIRAHRAEGVDAAVLLADLDVQREAAGPEGFAFRGSRRGCLGSRLRRGVGCAPVVRWWDAVAWVVRVLDLRVSQSGAPGVRYRPKR